MAKPALGEEGEVEGYDHDCATGDEERFEAESTDVGDVGYRLVGLHGWVVRSARGAPVDEHPHQRA